MAVQTSPRPASKVQPWPRLAMCDCGEPVLQARHSAAGRPATLNATPILPLGRCGNCSGRGTVGADLYVSSRNPVPPSGEAGDLAEKTRYQGCLMCPVCLGTGRSGERLDARCVLVDTDGVARAFNDDRRPWEAIHRRHRCTP